MTPEQTALVTAGHIKGIPQGQIAEQVGMARETVNRHLHRPEIKALIEREAAEIINRGLKPARRTLTRLAALGNNPTTDKDHLKLSLDAAKHITSMAGLSGGAPGTIINALIQVNQAPEQSKELSGIAAFLSNQWMTQPISTIPIDIISTNPVEMIHSETVEIETGRPIGINPSHTAQPDGDVIEVEVQEVAGVDTNDTDTAQCG
jgi:DNA-binding Lrp family transcriptional regulator